MTTARQLFDLQELDLAMDEHTARVSSIDHELSDRSHLVALAAEIEARKNPLAELRTVRASQELEAEAIREKLREEEAKLYGGSITNVRELEALEKETAALKEQLQALDEQLIEAIGSIDEIQGQLQSYEEELTQSEAKKEKDQVDLTAEKGRLDGVIAELTDRRPGMTANLQQIELSRYDKLRLSKGGIAIAKVERGLCRGCRMALPTHQLQRARAGRETVLCSTCGRILFVS